MKHHIRGLAKKHEQLIGNLHLENDEMRNIERPWDEMGYFPTKPWWNGILESPPLLGGLALSVRPRLVNQPTNMQILVCRNSESGTFLMDFLWTTARSRTSWHPKWLRFQLFQLQQLPMRAQPDKIPDCIAKKLWWVCQEMDRNGGFAAIISSLIMFNLWPDAGTRISLPYHRCAMRKTPWF